MEILQGIPIPPPWRELSTNSGMVYLNEITGEESNDHPLTKIIHIYRPNSTNEMDPETQIGILDDDIAVVSEVPIVDVNNVSEFRCFWQESDLLGKILFFGMTMRYFIDDNHIEIMFDGVDGGWIYSYLEGSHGPISRYDLFVGAKVKLFGRCLTIRSCTASAAEWIDMTAKEMRARRTWLQSKIESIGVTAVIPRAPPTVTRHITRETKNGGKENLRKLDSELMKLEQQLSDIGLV
eukprot:gene9922-20631_t